MLQKNIQKTQNLKLKKNKKKITYYENYIEKLQLPFESSNENQKIKKLSKD